ncbi:MAG: FAD:protein FMN transferase [Cardiobacteriaceae bacterium]|nr:FAD:protein FMN transferase [Cardiobacteriaceae bacterium]
MRTSCLTTSAVKPKRFAYSSCMPLLYAVALLFAGTPMLGAVQSAFGQVGVGLAHAKDEQVMILKGKTMGTFWQVSLAHSLEQSALDIAQAEIEKRLAAVNQSMSTYIPDSEISTFNQSASLDSQTISAELAYVVQKGLEISQQTDGLYDITVMPLVNLWGFGPKKTERKPTEEEIQQTLSYVGYQNLHLNQQQLRKDHPQTAIDLSSIAKGYGVDAVVETLSALGYRDFLVDIGGETRASGQKYGKDWRIGIETPIEGSHQSASVIVPLSEGRAIATSGNYRNFIDYDGVRAVHTLNPRTGQPKASSLLSASVIANDCMTADGYATAMMAMGDDALAFAEKHQLAVVLIYAAEGKSFEVKQSSAMKQLLGE